MRDPEPEKAGGSNPLVGANYTFTNMSQTLIIVRGLPGSGKTTFAQMIAAGSLVISADNFFMDKGIYKFDKMRLGSAHKWCRELTETYIKGGYNRIYVANTFTTESEMKPYLELAEKYGCKVFSIIIENRHGNSSVHNVPGESIEVMRNRFSIKL